jgi:hypothetical protein
MLNWKDTSQEEQRLKLVMEWIFRNHPQLLEFLFKSNIPYLRDEPEKLIVEAGAFSSGEKVLIQVALDLWNGSGKALFWDVIHRLDTRNQNSVFVALQYLKIIPIVGAHRISTIKNGGAPFQEFKEEKSVGRFSG